MDDKKAILKIQSWFFNIYNETFRSSREQSLWYPKSGAGKCDKS